MYVSTEMLKQLVNTAYVTFSVENSVLDYTALDYRSTSALQNTAACILQYPLYD